MKVQEFTEKVRSRKPEFSHLDDTDLIQMVAQRKPELLQSVDRDDMALTFKESRKRKISQERQKSFKSLSGYSRFMAGTGQGMLDTFMGIKQLLGGDTEAYKETKRVYEEAAEGDVLSGLGEITGAIAATAPIPGITGAKLAGKVAAPLVKKGIIAGTAAGVGGLMGATEFVDEEETRLKNATYGALFGAGGAGAGLLAKKVGTKAFNALKGRYKDANIQELMDLSKKYDIPLTKGDVTGKAPTRKTEVALESKVGGISPEREVQSKAVDKAILKAEKMFRPKGEKKPLGPSEVGKRLKKSTEKGFAEARKVAKKNYDKVEKLSGGTKIIPENSLNAVNKIKKEMTGDLPSEKTTVDWFDQLYENLSTGKKNFSSLRKTRQQLGKEAQKYAVSDPNRRRQLLKIQSAIETDMEDAIEGQIKSMTARKGRSMKKLAGADLMNPFQKAEMRKETLKQTKKGEELKKAYEIAKKQYREDVVPYKTSKTLKSILKQEEPDQIFKTMIKDGYSDRAKTFYKALDKKGQETVEYGIIRSAMNKARTETEFGEVYSPVKFSSELDKLDEAAGIFINPSKKKYVDGVKKVLKAAKRAGQYMENPPTGNRSEIAKEIRNARLTLGLLPLLTKGEKFFATGKGKNFILAASELEPGSVPMQNLIAKIYKNIPKLTSVTAKELGE